MQLSNVAGDASSISRQERERERERASSIVCQDFEGCVRWHGLVLFPHVFLQHPGTVLQLGCSK